MNKTNVDNLVSNFLNGEFRNLQVQESMVNNNNTSFPALKLILESLILNNIGQR